MILYNLPRVYDHLSACHAERTAEEVLNRDFLDRASRFRVPSSSNLVDHHVLHVYTENRGLSPRSGFRDLEISKSQTLENGRDFRYVEPEHDPLQDHSMM